MANELRFSVVVDDSGAIKSFKNLKTQASAAGSGISSGFMSAGGALSKVEKGLGGVGTALGHAKSQITGLLGSVGLLAGAGGLLSLGGALEQGISKASDMALAVEKVTGATNLSAQAASQAVAVFGKYGISSDQTATMLGRLEKNAFTSANTAKLAAKFQAEYGVSLVDSTGKVKDASTLLGTLSDFYLKNGDSAQTDATMAKLLGKNWIDLIPVLKLGSQGLADQAKQADAMGTTLDSALDVQNVQAFTAAQRDAGEAVSGLEMQLGLLVMPDLKAGLKSFTSFVMANKPEIKAFFTDALHAGEEFVGFVTGTVVPSLETIGGAAVKVWNMVPGPVKDLLVKGFLADKAIKWTFGIDVAGLVGSSLKGVIGGAISNLFKNATTASMAVQAGVVNVAGAGVPGGAVNTAMNAAEGAAGAGAVWTGFAGLVAGAITVAAPLAVAAVAFNQASNINDQANQLAQTASDFAKTATYDQLIAAQKANANAAQQLIGAGGYNPLAGFAEGGVTQTAQILAQALAQRFPNGPATITGENASVNDTLVKTGNAQIAAYKSYRDGERQDLGEIATLIGNTNSILSKEWESASSKTAGITARSMAAHGGVMPGQSAIDATFAHDLIKKETQVVADGHTTASKITDLQKLEALAVAKGDTKTAATITKAIQHEQAVLKAAIDDTTAAVKGIGGVYTVKTPGGGTRKVSGGSTPTSGAIYEGAQGMLGQVSSATHMIVGEAGNETVAVLRNARSMQHAASGGQLTVNVNLASATGIITPGAARQIMAELGPLLTMWLQRQGLMPRLGTPLRG